MASSFCYNEAMIELAGCVIRDTEGKLLLLHRNTEEITQWELPGGKVEPGEGADATAIREIKEEIGLDVEIIRKLGEASFWMNEKQWHYEWFEAEILDGGEPTILEEDTFDALQYWATDELRERADLSPNVQNLLSDPA